MEGIQLKAPHGRLIAEGIETAIVLPKKFADKIDKEFILVSGKFAFGILELESIRPISYIDFQKLRDKHQVSDPEAKTWWKDLWALKADGQPFMYYEFRLVKAFLPPKPIVALEDKETFILSVEFKQRAAISKELEDLIDWTDLVGLTEQELKNVHNEVVEHARLQLLPLSFLVPKFQLVKEEMIRRGLATITNLPGDKAVTLPSGEKTGPRIRLRDIMEHFASFDICNPFIFVTGEIVSNGYSDNDIEIMIREPGETICPRCNGQIPQHNAPVEFRIQHMFPEHLRERIRFSYDTESCGPFTSFIPLFALGLHRLPPNMTRMSIESSKQEENIFLCTKCGASSSSFDEELQCSNCNYSMVNCTKYKVEEELSRRPDLEDKGISYEEETAVIRFNKLTQAAQKPHKFVAARWTCSSGNPRCIICGLGTGAPGNRHAGTCPGLRGQSEISSSPFLRPSGRDVRYAWKILRKRGKGRKDLNNAPQPLVTEESISKVASDQGSEASADTKKITSAGSKESRQPGRVKLLDGEFGINVEVVAKRQVVTTQEGKRRKIKAWNYAAALRNEKDELIPVGITFNAPFDAPVGSIIRVGFVSLDRWADPKTGSVWFNWWSPRLLERREDLEKPDAFEFAEDLVSKSEGEKGEKVFPIRFVDYMRTGRLSVKGGGGLWEENYLLGILRKADDGAF